MKQLLLVFAALLIFLLNWAALHDILVPREPDLVLEWLLLGGTVASLGAWMFRRLRKRAV
jgi:hypothetical protein